VRRSSLHFIEVILALLPLLVGGGACAKYEYNLVRPPELSRHIGSSVDAVATIDPLEYRMRTVDNRLVLRIFNQADEPVELLGPRSAAVDPGGQSHPFHAQAIPPGAFIKLIIPPVRPQVYQPYYGPEIGFGVGAYRSVDARPYPHYEQGWPYWHTYPPYYRYAWPGPFVYPAYWGDPPYYFVMVDENDTYYWDWKDEGECRLILVYTRAGKEFTHDLLFRRQKM
jgi:hypothetical protein